MTNILDTIVAHKKNEVADRKARFPSPLADATARETRPFRQALKSLSRMTIIAEYKRASPSKGVIRTDLEPVDVACEYETHGASAISVLTDEEFFQGMAEYLTSVRAAVRVPILRKDFTIDEYQIDETFAMGADAILLIAAILSDDQLLTFQRASRKLGLACLVEVHNPEELERSLAAGADIIGVNNRDLRDFSVDINTSISLRRHIPDAVVTVSESGIHTREDILELRDAGFDAVLVGESLMRAQDIGYQLRMLTGERALQS